MQSNGGSLKGFDPRDITLVAFGRAGPLHAAAPAGGARQTKDGLDCYSQGIHNLAKSSRRSCRPASGVSISSVSPRF